MPPPISCCPARLPRTALELFQAAETETLPQVSDAQERRIIGYVIEAYALRRYSEEPERRRAEDVGERWFRSHRVRGHDSSFPERASI